MSWGNEVSSSERPVRRRRDWFTIFLLVACAALAVLVVLLARENRRLKAALSAPALGQAAPEMLKAGECVTPFDVLGEAGRAVRVEFGPGQPRTLLLVFSSQCPACARTIPVWNEITAAVESASVRVVGVQLDQGQATGAAGAPNATAARFPVFGVGSARPGPLAKIPYVPVAALLAGDGVVEHVWVGAPESAQVEELRGALAAPAAPATNRCGG